MSLRNDLIETMTRRIFDLALGVEASDYMRSRGSVALDAALDYLTDHADGWVEERYPNSAPSLTLMRRAVARNLLSVLGESAGVGEDL